MNSRLRQYYIDRAVQDTMNTFDEVQAVVKEARARGVDRTQLTECFYCCREHRTALEPLFDMLWPVS